MVALWLALALAAAQAPHDMPQDNRPATLVEGLGSTHHAIATKSEEAQRFFARLHMADPGLRAANVQDRVAYRRPADNARLVEGLRKAGLAE